MEPKLRKDILRIIKDNDYAMELNRLNKILVEKYGHERVIEGQIDILSSRVHNYLKILTESGLIISQPGQEGGTQRFSTFYSLTEKGYKEFDPWYKKFWNFINEDFAKLLSLVSLILSIFATFVSFLK